MSAETQSCRKITSHCATTCSARPYFFTVWLATLHYVGSVFHRPSASVVTSCCSFSAPNSGRNKPTGWTNEEKRSNPDTTRLSLFSKTSRSPLWGPPSQLFNGTGRGRCLLGEQNGWCVKLSTHVYRVPRLRTCGVILPSPPHMPSRCAKGQT